MARKAATVTAQPVDDAIDTQKLEAAARAHHEHAQQVAVVERDYGIDIAYNLDSYVHSIRQHAAESAMRLIEIGRMLIQIRERETRDAYLDALDKCGVTPRFAQKTMQAAIKLQDRPKLQLLGSSKVLELLSEDDETLEALEDGGSVAGLTLDEIDTLTVRELKQQLRTERKERAEEAEASNDLLRAKDERINKLSRAKAPDPADLVRDQARDFLQDADAAVVEATAQLTALERYLTAIDQLYADAGLAVDEDIQARIDQNREWAAASLSKLDV